MACIDADVCVIGGGPAGSSFALRLAQLGHTVVVLEREVFPRLHVGEAFTAGIHVPLSVLGVAQEVYRSGVLQTQGTIRAWEHREAERAAPATGRPGMAVDRGVFDQLLLDQARASGVRVLQPASPIEVTQTGERWQIAVRGSSPIERVSARFVADASGRVAALRRLDNSDNRRGGPGCPPGPTRAETTIAFAGYWRLSRDPDSMTRLEAAPEGWYWGTPLPGNRFVGMAFGEAGTPRSTPPEAHYLELVQQSALLKEVLTGARLERVVVRDATCRAAREPIGPAWIRLGEASVAIDPLSSSGVQKALQTSLSGAIVVHTQLTCPDRAEAAMTFYRDDQRSSVTQHARWAGAAYAQVRRFEDRPFWRRRSTASASDGQQVSFQSPVAGQQVRVAGDTRLVPVPCVVGNLIDVRMAIAHPRLDRPVAFLDEIPVATLLESIRGAATDEELAERWTPLVPIARGRAVARWLIERGILVGA